MLLLAFDTATPVITVAVHDGTRVVGEAAGEGAMAHGELLAPAIRDALAQAGASMSDLTDVAVGVGPGPFTGLRVGVVTALTLGSTLGITTHGVCSLDIVAADIQVEGEFLVATDARRKEVYWARYAADHLRLDGPHVLKPADLAIQHPDLPAYGPGAGLYDGVLRA
ncbi:MAG: tRNA (adenosine(37)-N6)-threonylcarbamoyltransferase complex dimerization subunit type 1 TsaB, partial [Aeromicrobium sp.]